MNPAWFVVAIAASGAIFQAGIAYATLGEIKRIRVRQERHETAIEKVDRRCDQHEWRITGHDGRLNGHDARLEELRSAKNN